MGSRLNYVQIGLLTALAHQAAEREGQPKPPQAPSATQINLDHLVLVPEDDLRLNAVALGIDWVAAQEAPNREDFLRLISKTAEGMFKVMMAHKGIGLAAPQVGIGMRLIVGRSLHEGWSFAFTNPVIVKRSDQLFLSREGCLSLPGKRCAVYRHKQVLVHAHDLSGNPVKLKARGLLSAVLQHEIEHLDGILMTRTTGSMG